MGLLRHIKVFLKANAGNMILGMLVLIGIDALQLVTPKLLGNLADDLTSKTLTQNGVFLYMFYIIGIAILVAIGRFWWRILISGTSRKAEYWLRNKLFAHLETLSWEYFSKNKVGDLMALATNDVTAVGASMGQGIVMLIDAVFMSLMTLYLMIVTIDPTLTLVALVPMPFIAFLVTFGGMVMRKRFKRVQEAFSHMTDRVQESFSGIRIIKSYTREDHHRDLFKETNQENLKENMTLVKLWGIMFPLVKTISSISLVITLFYGSYLVIDEKISVGMFVAFISYVGMLTWPMMAIGWVVNIMQRGNASLQRINEFLDIEPSFGFGEEPIRPAYDETIPVLRIKNLSYAYPEVNAKVLKNMNFEVRRGQKVGIIGTTGSGKSTLIQLLTKTYLVPDDKIYIEGHDINTLTQAAIKNYFAVVPQDNFLFSRSIEENIHFFEPSVSFEDVGNAATIANVHKEILEFTDGYQTLLGERGVNLSGGQKQRIGIARALLKRSEVIVLDDSLSAVDTKTEEAILKHLKEELSSRTAIIIAHRISAIKDCDYIYVLDDGKIVESGTHESLTAGSGLYRHIFDRQQLEEKIAEE